MKKIVALMLAMLTLAVSLPGYAASGWDISAGNSGSRSTDRLPKPADFDWFWNQKTGELTTNVPDGAKMIIDPEDIAGGWMVLLMRRPNTDPNPSYWNIDLQIKGKRVDATQHWSGTIENGSFTDWSGANSNP